MALTRFQDVALLLILGWHPELQKKIMDRLQFEKKLWAEGYRAIMGLDEAGRGSLCGPVVAAGVIFEEGTFIEGVRDSKQLSLKQRLALEPVIKEKAVFWTVRECSPAIIDEINILQASLRAMDLCTQSAKPQPDYLLIDGNKYLDTLYPHQCLIGGDDLSQSIAAASILAKVHRDRYMKKLHKAFPNYGWDTNVGYATKKHFAGLKKFGITKHHRRSFNLHTRKEFKPNTGASL